MTLNQKPSKSSVKKRKPLRLTSGPVQPETESPAPVIEDRLAVVAPSGLGKFGFTRQPVQMPTVEAVVMRVNIGLPTASGIQLTALREMAACPPSVLGRGRVIRVNSGNYKGISKSPKDATNQRRELVRITSSYRATGVIAYGAWHARGLLITVKAMQRSTY